MASRSRRRRRHGGVPPLDDRRRRVRNAARPCPSGQSCCGGGCVDTHNDHRGACGRACSMGSGCVGRVCDPICAGGTFDATSFYCGQRASGAVRCTNYMGGSVDMPAVP